MYKTKGWSARNTSGGSGYRFADLIAICTAEKHKYNLIDFTEFIGHGEDKM